MQKLCKCCGKGEESKEYIISMPIIFDPDIRGLGHMFFRKMKLHSDKIAQYIIDLEERDSYRDLLLRCIRTSIEMESKKLTHADRVAICSYGHLNSCVPFIASLFLSIPVAAIDLTLPAPEITHLLNIIKPKIIFVVPEKIETIEAALKNLDLRCEIVVFGATAKYISFSTFLRPQKHEASFQPKHVPNLKTTAVIVFTNGTTGIPKGVELSHYSILIHCRTLKKSGNFGNVVLSYAFTSSIIGILILAVSTNLGTSRLVCARFDKKFVWNLISNYKVNTIVITPFQAAEIISLGNPSRHIDQSNLWVCLVGGDRVTEYHLLMLRNIFSKSFVFQFYGTTEMGGPITSFKLDNLKDILLLRHKPNSIGMIQPGVECKVVHPHSNKQCGPYELGELQIKSKLLTFGYMSTGLDTDFKTEWFRTGDIVYFDLDHCFYYIGRINDTFKYTMSSAEESDTMEVFTLENTLVQHPAVHNAVVFGVADSKENYFPLVVVVLLPIYEGKISISQLINFVEERTPESMYPDAQFQFVNSLPMTASGKFSRNKLLNWLRVMKKI